MRLTITSEEGTEPVCRHFRQCGGCQFQHIPYDEQLTHKRAFVSQCFEREVLPVIPSDPAWRYRNKMEFSFSQSRAGEKFLGLMKKRGRVENLEECFLSHSWFIQTLKNVREWWKESSVQAYYPPNNTGLLRTLTLREGVRTQEKMVILTVSGEEFEAGELSSFIEAIPPVDSLILRRQITQKKMATRFEEEVLAGKPYIHETLFNGEGRSWHFQIKAASFFQPNTLQAEVIYQTAMDYADLQAGDDVLDLYCGTGAIGIFASQKVKKVLGIELVAEAVADAHTNLKLNHVTNMQVEAADVAEVLKKNHSEPTLVFVDPPRSGLGGKTVAELIRLKPEKIVYISCNPVTQAADCKDLGYEILALQPIDQFPHTAHIENIALLRRSA